MPYLAARGTNLFYSDWGRGAPVVFVHAWGLSSAQWDYQIPDLVAAGRRCVTFDKRGHGRSDRTPTGYDHDGHAADLAAVLEHLDLTGVTLVAHSFGCGNAVRYLTRYGDGRVSALRARRPVDPASGADARQPRWRRPRVRRRQPAPPAAGRPQLVCPQRPALLRVGPGIGRSHRVDHA